MHLLKRLFVKGANPEEQLHRKRFAVFMFFGFPTLLFFITSNLLHEKYLIAGVELAVLFLFSLMSWGLTKGGHDRVIYSAGSVLYGAFLLYLVWQGGAQGGNAMWGFTFPMIAVFLVGKKGGSLLCTLFGVFLLITIQLQQAAGEMVFPVAFQLRFFIALFIVSGLSLWFESLRLNTLVELEAKHVVLLKEINERKRVELERECLITELREALDEVRTLSGFLPICASCHKIRDDKGYWNRIEEYLRDHSEITFSHGLCPDCIEGVYGELNDMAGAADGHPPQD